MLAYKFLANGGTGRFSGFEWPAPVDGEPGAWVSAEGSIAVCVSGVHACRVADLPDWIDDELWTIELSGEIREESSMVVGERGRLLQRVDGWDEQAAADFADACAWRARDAAARALRRDGALAQAEQLESTDDLVDMQIVAALASRTPAPTSAVVAGYAADAVALAHGQRPDTWDLAVALAEPAPAQTPAATAANLGFVVAHVAAVDAAAEAGDESVYATGFARERAWQLHWLKERLGLRA